MRRIVAEAGRPKVIDIEPPECPPGSVMVGTQVSTVSAGTESTVIARSADPAATDVEYPGEPPYERPSIRRWMRTSPEPKPPLAGRFSLGYSLAGTVLKVGTDVPDIEPGDQVACAGSQDAHHAEVVAVSRSLVTPVPDGLDIASAAFVTLGGVAAEAVRRTGGMFGESVLIVGLGLIGQIAAQVAKHAGLTVIGVEPSPTRRERAMDLGIDYAIDPTTASVHTQVLDLTDGFGADAALLTLVSQSSEPLNEAMRATRRGGRVVGVGVFGMDLTRDVVMDRTYVHAVAFGSGRYDPWYEEGNVDYPIQLARWTENRTMALVLNMLKEGAVSVADMAESYPMGEAEAAYSRLSADDRPFTVQFTY